MKARNLLLIMAFALLMLPALAAGQPASLLLDINTTTLDDTTPHGVDSYGLQAAGNRLFFLANAGGTGYEMWTSDGTSAGTQIVRDLCPGPCDANTNLIGALGNVMLWSTDLTQLWRSDGTRPGTFALTGPDVKLQGFGASTTAFFRGSFYFGGCSGPGSGFNQDCDLWKTDGSVAGTRIFHHSPHVFEWLFVAGDKLYFLKGDDQGTDLWVTNGTPRSTVQLRHFADGPNIAPHGAVAAGGRLFFLARDGGVSEQLWTSDGTAAGTRQLTSFPGSQPLGTFPKLKPEGNRLYFLADDSLHGLEIWRSDGTVVGTVRVTDLMDDSPFTGNGSDILTEVGGVVVFRANDPRSPSQLWMSSGTPESTAPFPLCTSCALDPYTGLIDSGGKAFFLLYPAGGGVQLGVTDGTTAGSRALPLCNFCSVDALQSWKGGLLLLLSASSQKPQIWLSDGTPKGTGPFINLPGRVNSSNPIEVAEIGNRLYFLTTDGTPGLWARDAAGTIQPVFSFPRAEPTSDPGRLAVLGNRLLFTAWDGSSPFDLWSSTGTPETTSRLSLPPEIDWNDAATGLVPAAGLLFFQIRKDFDSFDLWRTDGTRQGTFVIAHLTDTNPAAMVPYQGKLYFFHDAQIWRTDGTTQGTVKTGDYPADLSSVEVAAPGPNGIYLKTVTNPYHTELWFTDGTTAGTRQLTHFNGPGVAG